jgi:hypothetical protein
MLRNRAYIAQIDVPEFGIWTRGDFEPLITERIFFACKESSMAATK